MNLIELFMEQAARHPQRLAIIGADASITYSELRQRSTALAQHLTAAGLRQGNLTMPIVDVGIPLYVTLLALFRLGAVAVFPEPGAGWRGVRAAAGAVAIDALVGDWRRHLLRRVLPELRHVRVVAGVDARRLGSAADPADLAADTPALITFTSGSTGRSKGILRNHGFLLEQQRQISAVLQPQDDDIALVSLPVFILGNLANGISSVIPDLDPRHPGEANPATLREQIARHRINQLILSPALCKCLAESGSTMPGITRIFTGGGPLFPDLLRQLVGLAPNAKTTLIYGSSEAEPIARISLDEVSPQDFQAMAQGAGLLAGIPVNDIRLHIEDGEIWVSGPHVVEQYLDTSDDADIKKRIGERIWHRTGDAGRVDEHGRLWLLGRHRERSGEFYPFVVEAVARSMQGVRNAAFLNAGASAILAIEQDSNAALPPPSAAMARWPDNLRVVTVPRIPMDRRHNSKVDYGRLRKMLRHRLAAGEQFSQRAAR